MLADVVLRKIDCAIESTPCGRCTSDDHPTKECPLKSGKKANGGWIWRDLSKSAQPIADKYLKNHKDYPSSVQAFQGEGWYVPQQQHRQRYVLSKHNFSYVTAFQGDGREGKLPEDMAMRNEPAKISGSQYPFRVSFFKDYSGEKVILTNHYEYHLDTDKFYEYKIIDLDTKNRKRMRQLIETAITHWTFLQGNHDSFATNYIDTIVSWKPLHLDLGQTDQDREWSRYIPTAKDASKPVRFKYVRSFDAGTLREYASANPGHENENFEDIATCLNIVISKSFGSQIHKLSSNRFFVKSARTPLRNGNTVSNQLELICGYLYNVKPGMGNIILNFNVYTSAIFRPTRIDGFLFSNNTFAHDPPERLESVLKGKAVYLILDRKDKDPKKQKLLNHEKSRYWKVWEIQPKGNIEDKTFTRPVSPPKQKDDGTPVTRRSE